MHLNLEIGVTVSKDLESLGTAVGRGAAPTLRGSVATGSLREEGAGLEDGSTVGMGSLFGAYYFVFGMGSLLFRENASMIPLKNIACIERMRKSTLLRRRKMSPI